MAEEWRTDDGQNRPDDGGDFADADELVIADGGRWRLNRS